MGKDSRETAGFAGGRRRFLRQALATAAGAPFALSLASDALGEGRGGAEITLDALLVTYVAAPLGSPGSTNMELTTRYESALSLGVDGVDLLARVPSAAERVFLGGPFAQVPSHGDLVLRRRDRNAQIAFGTPTPGVPDHTVYYGFLRPRVRVRELGRGGSELRAGYSIVGADSTFLFTRDSLLHDEQVIGRFAPSTIESYLEAYRFDAESLVAPRYEPRGTFGGGATVNLIERGTSAAAGPEVSALTSASVVAVEGLNGSPLADALAVGRTVAVEHMSRQTPTNKAIAMATAELGEGGTLVFWDRAFKTFVFAA